ncbi:calmodulin, putative [Plasmodium knowlesi strain H]|uniref:Calmodulin n=3 Tax=Plasmodium knowlesi TaxID=5850 RepID=A0A5K1UG62_PLAKH|nr:calmodulin, putative [Plasmodium knowlesi strain H]OTN68221.1 putative Calmodulin [Plasmodium knowlesi]CAA9987205.1 calmodulin, putative [Plasmodium knowlesi strain H]SBO23969.1 calmodulin, putative [Plasmodium knowlesi strain H]SBO25928.1 calmodulin, putative [Plasmodium knowlesi strain H]VVS76679.1 calmodulin, putative [Plasmodium knowlesi strain H]|eukprot:XP_002261826.1 calmodulin, putative [Plasmodium knowlesi strain H]
MQGNSISQEKLQLMQKNFNLVDNNKDGKISAEEFKTLLRLLGQTRTEKEMDEMVDKHFEYIGEEEEQEQTEATDATAKGGIDKGIQSTGKQSNGQKNTAKASPSHDRIKNLITKLNNFKNEEKKKGNPNIQNNKRCDIYERNELMNNRKKHINFETFLTIFLDIYEEPLSVDELITSFEFFDKEKSGYLDEEKMRFILKNSDEKLVDEDMKLFFKSLNLKDKDKIDYVMLAKRLKNVT